MKTVTAQLSSLGAYSQGKIVSVSKLAKETHDEFDARTWRQRMHVTDKGNVFIPCTAFKNALSEAAKYMSLQIPGKGKATYTKHFESGVLCTDNLVLPLKADEVEGERLFVPADGKRGSGKRVFRIFPLILQWEGKVTFHVIDDTVLQESDEPGVTIFEKVLAGAGQFIGIGRFRPRNNGFYGRFSVDSISIQ